MLSHFVRLVPLLWLELPSVNLSVLVVVCSIDGIANQIHFLIVGYI